MDKAFLGVIWAFAFVFLESFQAVFFGGLFQSLSPYLFGFLVFGITSLGFVGWTALKKPQHIKNALNNPRPLIAINIAATIAVMSYLVSIKLIEPAIAYCISAGAMPITTYVLFRLGVREGEGMRNRFEAAGNALLFCGIVYLAGITITGSSGFVREGAWEIALIGVLLAVLDGVLFTWVLVYGQRLDKVGVGPDAVFGLRFMFYICAAGGLALTDPAPAGQYEFSELSMLVLIGLLLTIPPLYALQRAIALISTLTISAFTSLGPFIIFALQMMEGRVEYSTQTLIGLIIYSAGAMIASIGAYKAATNGGN
ncbi:MAG: hypothetical protein HON65_05835 [Rhodospirillales bacterium]|jgi:drug/metabolite transporter (DMT)-like permease|nr:hypothetical protein [Rhodospirillales bacterium]